MLNCEEMCVLNICLGVYFCSSEIVCLIEVSSKFMQDKATIFTFSISLFFFSIHVNWWSSKCIFPQLFALIMFAYLLLPLRYAVKAWFFLIVSINHCVKSVRIRSFLVHIVTHSVWIRRDIKYLSVVSTNAEKCKPEKPQIRTLFS